MRIRQISCLILLFFPLILSAFTHEPWFSPIGEFELRTNYSYRYYPSINRGFNPSGYSSHDHFIKTNCGVNFWPNWEAQIEWDFACTHKLNWGTERFGMQLRYLLLDDVAGDTLSLAVAGQIFYVPTRNMRDVSSPYHSQGNLELGVSLGKEIDNIYEWIWRLWSFLGVGFSNRGSPWIRPLLSLEGKFYLNQKLSLFLEGYFGFGDQSQVNINRFNGYANIAHHSIDLGLKYTYLFRIWGALRIQYSYRLYAHAFPQHASTFTIEYRLPFSLF